MKTLVVAVLAASSCLGASSVLNFAPKSIEGQTVPLSEYKGKVLLIVNVASKCGYTPQYAGLESLYRKYKDRGLVILGFPANNFMSQEPGTNSEIKQFCKNKYDVTFPMFAKISVKGEDEAPLYQFLTNEKTNPNSPGDIKWNFTQFLIGRDGKIDARFEPATTPESPEITSAVESALKASN